jgi:hypothetical protein
MMHSVSPHVATAEQRREVRRAGKGQVVVHWITPRPAETEGRLVDVSRSGFRMAHRCAELSAGQEVEFTHGEGQGRARVVWTRIIAGTVETGFVVTGE